MKIPSFNDVEQKPESEWTAVDRFIYLCEPSSMSDSIVFRQQLQSVVDEVEKTTAEFHSMG